MTRTSRAGRSSEQSGFTLIELAVVLIILATVLGMTLNLMGSSFLQDDFKKDLRQLQGLISQLRQEAMLKKKEHRLVLGLGSAGQMGAGTYVVRTGPDDPDEDKEPELLFSKDVTVLGIKLDDEILTTTQKVPITFTPQGLIKPFQLFVMSGDTRYTLSVEAFSSRIEIEESEQFL